ncbi:hypothetical protein NXS08_04590 [Gleimia sp. 6138-11-ORH1]|uniref:hypothetical protein n=1 Tax=Gleimia sp. 6138-11-ORH1 TaxID=2973937 RepID=UPI00216A5B8F|nr:hypothetical protein [Gleimia sp. 6138-11-ORH1]MCS4484754.1 hypothetical protein [Gleimia sp. 6138-11-ORH1]
MKYQRSSLFLSFLVGLFLTLSLLPAQATRNIIINDQLTDPEDFIGIQYSHLVRKSLGKAQDKGVQLYFVALPVIDEQPLTTWCENTAQASNLPNNALVFAIGYENRVYVTCKGSQFPVDEQEITKATSQAIKKLKNNPLQPSDLAGAFDAFAISISEGDINGAASSASSGTSTSSGKVTSFIKYGVLASVPVALFAFLKLRRKPRPHSGSLASVKTTEELLKETASQLMETDNSIRAAADDLAFAQAQFGQLETSEFAEALTEAQTYVSDAFVLHSQLVEQTDQRLKRQQATQILELLAKANQAVADKVERFNKLRTNGANLPQTITDLELQISEAEEKNQVVRAEIEALRTLHSDVVLQSLFDNPQNIDNLLAAAKNALEVAKAELAKQSTSGEQAALQQVTFAQRSFGQAIWQINEVMYASHDLNEAPTRLATAMSSLGADIQDAQRLAPGQAGIQSLVTSAQEALTQAQQALSGAGDVLAALTSLRLAEDALDAALAPLRAADEQRQRAGQRFSITNQEVTDLIRQADGYINARRGGVSEQARTHLANAELAQQRAGQQLQACLNANKFDQQCLDACFNTLYQAKSYAQAALSTASENVRTSYQQYGQPGYSPSSPRNSQAGGIDLFSLIIGGILSSSGSNRSSHSSSSGSDWDFSGGGFSGGGWSSGSGGWSSSSSGSF